MEIIKPPKQVFMAKFERFEPLSRDHTAIIAAKTCMRLYFYKIVLGFSDKVTPQFFVFGSSYHKFREVLDKTFMETGDQTKSVKTALQAAIDYFQRHGTDPVPGTKFDFLTQARLIQSCVKAFEVWKKEKAGGRIEIIAVEQEFEVTMKDGKTRRGGKADAFIKWNGKLAGRDYKTSSKSPNWYDRTVEPNDQFTGYLWGLSRLSGSHVGILDVNVLFNSKKEGPKIQSFLATRTASQLDRWEDEQIIQEKMIDVCRDADTWPMQEKNCVFCEMHSVCKAGSEQAQMVKLETEFKQKPWDYKTIGGEK